MAATDIDGVRIQLERLKAEGVVAAGNILEHAAALFSGERPTAVSLLGILPETLLLPSPADEAVRDLALAMMAEADWGGVSAAAEVRVLPSPLHSSGSMTVVMQGQGTIESVGGMTAEASDLPPLMLMEPDDIDVGARMMVAELRRKATCIVVPREEALAYVKGEGRWWRLCTFGEVGVAVFRFCRWLGLTPEFTATRRYMRAMTAGMERDHVDALDFAIPGWRGLSAYVES